MKAGTDQISNSSKIIILANLSASFMTESQKNKQAMLSTKSNKGILSNQRQVTLSENVDLAKFHISSSLCADTCYMRLYLDLINNQRNNGPVMLT